MEKNNFEKKQIWIFPKHFRFFFEIPNYSFPKKPAGYEDLHPFLKKSYILDRNVNPQYTPIVSAFWKIYVGKINMKKRMLSVKGKTQYFYFLLPTV